MLNALKLREILNAQKFNPLPLWETAHISRRCGVMVILSPAPKDDVDVLLTIRSKNLSYAGDAALPGGKADEMNESPWNTALRETNEEVGIKPSSLEFLATMPGYVSSRLLMVVPSVAWSAETPVTNTNGTNEVHKVFRIPLSRFLKAEGHHYRFEKLASGTEVKLSHFDIPAVNKKVGEPKNDRVWGLTANILIDCAKLVYGRDPEFEFKRGMTPKIDDLSQIGNMRFLENLARRNVLQSPVKPLKKT